MKDESNCIKRAQSKRLPAPSLFLLPSAAAPPRDLAGELVQGTRRGEEGRGGAWIHWRREEGAPGRQGPEREEQWRPHRCRRSAPPLRERAREREEFEIFLATVQERWEERVPMIFNRMVGIF